MPSTPKPIITQAGLHRLCCDYKEGGPTSSTSKACWELYLVVFNSSDPWPAYTWPVSRRHQVPTVAERTEALAALGYAPAPDSEWEWQESDTPPYHGHPTAVSLIAGISIVPLEGGGA
ncbi:DUF6303 family protein [Streptomyces kebangsaanensis]|uniref:DUF6303 family protein n=1 Tax=Streptomyces kebangsaanensis TaxID=864058 RepID=UPI000ABC8725|nr:DUF6303 family protein [Streptomyces kebangsaanensis]